MPVCVLRGARCGHVMGPVPAAVCLEEEEGWAVGTGGGEALSSTHRSAIGVTRSAWPCRT